MIRKVANLGLMGLNVPEEYGGFPKDAVTVGVVLEELAKHADDAAWLVLIATFHITQVFMYHNQNNKYG